MFDWDRDIGSEVAPRVITPWVEPTGDASRSLRTRWRTLWPGVLGLALVGVLGLGLWSQMPWAGWRADPVPVSAAVFRSGPAPTPASGPAVVLRVYDAARAARFRQGLALFGADDLQRYAALTRHDLAMPRNLLAADLTDALTLIEEEIGRRGPRAAR